MWRCLFTSVVRAADDDSLNLAGGRITRSIAYAGTELIAVIGEGTLAGDGISPGAAAIGAALIDNAAASFLTLEAKGEVAIIGDSITGGGATVCEVNQAEGASVGCCGIGCNALGQASGRLVTRGIGDAGSIAHGLIITKYAGVSVAPASGENTSDTKELRTVVNTNAFTSTRG